MRIKHMTDLTDHLKKELEPEYLNYSLEDGKLNMICSVPITNYQTFEHYRLNRPSSEDAQNIYSVHLCGQTDILEPAPRPHRDEDIHFVFAQSKRSMSVILGTELAETENKQIVLQRRSKRSRLPLATSGPGEEFCPKGEWSFTVDNDVGERWSVYSNKVHSVKEPWEEESLEDESWELVRSDSVSSAAPSYHTMADK
jgi:hypothetical protein